jgi:DNA invertase Pin-like site-specific DNA recombinase
LYLDDRIGIITLVTSTRKRNAKADPTVAVGYTRVSTAGQVESGAGLDAQAATVTAECLRRGLTLARTYTDAGIGGGNIDNRPELAACLAALAAGAASVLIVPKVDRLSRSLADFASLMQRAEREGWRIVCCDLGIDTTSPAGELSAAVVAATAQYERRLISARTRDALAARKAAGVRLGRPRLLDPTVADRIRMERTAGATLQAIADGLNAENVKTPTGRWWSPALVRKVTVQTPARGVAA